MQSTTNAAAELFGLLQEAKRIAARYRELTGRPLGIAGEIAEAEAVRLLGLELAPVRTAGYDVMRNAPDGRVERLQVKGRVLSVGKPQGRLGSIDVKHPDWDAVLLVLMDLQFNTLAIYEAPRENVEREINREGSRARNERGSLSISLFCSPRVSRKVWPVVSANDIHHLRPDSIGCKGT